MFPLIMRGKGFGAPFRIRFWHGDFSNLADRSEVLDTWVEERRETRLVLYGLAPPLNSRGFMVEGVGSNGEVRLRRFFILTPQGLEAANGREAKRLLRRSKVGKLVKVLLSLTILSGLTLACGESTPGATKACPPISPKELPSGAGTGPARQTTGDYGPTISWGSGNDEVVLLVGKGGPAEDLGPGDGTSVRVRDQDGLAVSVEDSPNSQTFLSWLADGCRYTVWIYGTTNQAVDYSTRL
jgi:hypothetical protein